MDEQPPADGTLAETVAVYGGDLARRATLAACCPSDPTPLLATIQALLAANCLAKAELLLDADQFGFLRRARFAIEAARAAQRRGVTDEALCCRWQVPIMRSSHAAA